MIVRARSLALATAIVSLLAAMQSCTPHDEPPELKISPEPKPVPAIPPAPESQLKSLEKVTHSSGRLHDAVVDIHAILAAQDAEASGHFQDAATKWFVALGTAQGQVGKKALEGWIKTYTLSLNKKVDSFVLARLLLAETNNGRYSPYMASHGLSSEDALIPIIASLVPEWLEAPKDTEQQPAAAVEAPTGRGAPTDDPLLVKTANTYCRNKEHLAPAWSEWEQSLTESGRRYWQALILQCQGKDMEALKAFKAIYANLAKSPATLAWGLEAASRSVQLERAVGDRTQAADAYVELLGIWQKPGLKASKLGIQPMELALRRINDTLWAGRYRALIADYEHAKSYDQKALKLIAQAYNMPGHVSNNQREDLTNYKAEAYHDLAYRIALENKDFESALSLNLLALQIPNLNDEWRDRLQWLAGLYDYLGGHYEGAKRRWEAQLTTTKDDNQKAMLYFWLAKAYDQLNQKAESRFYLAAVSEDYPLSYYSVVAPAIAGFDSAFDGAADGAKNWRQVFGDTANLVDRLQSRRNYELDALRRDKSLGPLLLRAEITVAAHLDDWAKLTVNELDAAMHASLSEDSHVAAFVYLSRLQYACGNYLNAISITSQLTQVVKHFWQQWPEQLLIYFPRPYGEIYERNAGDNSLEKELLMAISRQESGFTPTIRSAANALGVMQLIRPTALRFAGDVGIAKDAVDLALQSPEANISLGSRYLKVLSLEYKGFPPAIYGAYNAGEAAVDIWLKRRAHSDPLMFVELIPFQETKGYIRNVWRNYVVYKYLDHQKLTAATLPSIILGPDDQSQDPAATPASEAAKAQEPVGAPATPAAPGESNETTGVDPAGGPVVAVPAVAPLSEP